MGFHTHTGSICAENGDRREPGDSAEAPISTGGMLLKRLVPPSGCILLVVVGAAPDRTHSGRWEDRCGKQN